MGFTENLIPPGKFEQLLTEIREKYTVKSLALVGHEPMLSQFVSWLTTGNTETKITLKKGGVCCLSVDKLEQGSRATLEWLLTPAVMVQLSK